VSVVAASLLFWLGYGYRMLVEEKVLVSELGESYVEYMKRTKRIIPFSSQKLEKRFLRPENGCTHGF